MLLVHLFGNNFMMRKFSVEKGILTDLKRCQLAMSAVQFIVAIGLQTRRITDNRKVMASARC
jgi:hypothetical protein